MLDPVLVAYVKKEEKFTAEAFWDFQQWTNGWGTRAHYPREVITEAEADRRLEIELSAAQAMVDHFKPGLPTGVRSALTDLTYNAGFQWSHAGLGEAVKDEDWVAVAAHLVQYDRAGGRVLGGLLERRKTEASWFSNLMEA